MTREDMIRQLVLDRLTLGGDIDRHIQLGLLLENGFPGFRNFTDGELKAELGLLGQDSEDEKYDGHADYFIHDEIFDSSLSAGHGLALHFASE